MPGDLDEVIVGGGPNGLTAVALSSAGMRVLMTQEPATQLMIKRNKKKK